MRGDGMPGDQMLWEMTHSGAPEQLKDQQLLEIAGAEMRVEGARVGILFEIVLATRPAWPSWRSCTRGACR